MFFFADALSFAVTITPALIAWSTLICFLLYSGFSIPAKIASSVFVLMFTFIAVVWLVRLCLPKLAPGTHRIGFNKMTIAWFIHMALARAVLVGCLENLTICINVFRFLYFRALGAKIPFQMNMSLGSRIADASLVTIGKHSTLGSNSNIYCHFTQGSFLVLSPNVIGEHVEIGGDCTLGPGNKIGDHCRLGQGARIVNKEMKPYSTVRAPTD